MAAVLSGAPRAQMLFDEMGGMMSGMMSIPISLKVGTGMRCDAQAPPWNGVSVLLPCRPTAALSRAAHIRPGNHIISVPRKSGTAVVSVANSEKVTNGAKAIRSTTRDVFRRGSPATIPSMSPVSTT